MRNRQRWRKWRTMKIVIPGRLHDTLYVLSVEWNGWELHPTQILEHAGAYNGRGVRLFG